MPVNSEEPPARSFQLLPLVSVERVQTLHVLPLLRV